jgi:hypothetical protein
MKYYSKSSKGFFDTEIHKVIPDDGISLTDEEYINILEEQSTGRVITVKNGKVITEEYVPTEEEIANVYKNRRKVSYPPISDQLDMIWHGMDSGAFPKLDSFYQAIKSVKDKYPKGEN